MKQTLQVLSVLCLVIILSSCGSSLMVSKKQDRPVTDGAIAYQPQEQTVPEVEEKSGFLGLKKGHPVSKKAKNGFKILKRAKDFTKTIAANSFKKLVPKRNTADNQSSKDITIGQILVLILILALLAVLLEGGLGQLINLLISLLIIVLLVLLILWLLGEV